MVEVQDLGIDTISRVGAVGVSGSGKSNTTHIILEHLRENNMPICVLDHKNEYTGLPGVRKLKGSQDPEYLVNWLIKSNASVVVNLAKMSLAGKRKWVARFLLEALRRPRTVPIMIVIEELRLYCPYDENPPSKTPIIDLASGGRSEGYGCMLISQRCSKISKDAFSQLTDMLIHRHTFKTDIKWLSDWLGKEHGEKLSKFKTGEALYLDLDHGNIQQMQFPESDRKIRGQTPKAKSVHEKHVEEPVRASRKSPGGIDALPLVFVVILFTFMILGLWAAKKGLDHEEALADGTSHA